LGPSQFESTSGQAGSGDAVTADSAPAEAKLPRPRWQVWSIALAGGIAAGLVAGLGGELAYGAFKPQLFRTEVLGMISMQPSTQSQNAAELKNAALAFFILGCATGLAMGIAGGLTVRAPARALLVGLGAQAAGGLIAVLASLALLPLFYRHRVPDINDLLSPILIQSGIWAPIGAVGGLAFGLGMGCRRLILGAIYGACIGAILAAALVQISGAIFFPDSRTTDPVASSPLVRLLFMAMVTVLIAAGAAWGPLLFRVPAPASAAPDH